MPIKILIRNESPISKQNAEWLKENYGTASCIELVTKLGKSMVSIHGFVRKQKAKGIEYPLRHQSVSKDRKEADKMFPVKYRIITDEELKWITDNWNQKSLVEIAEHLDITRSTAYNVLKKVEKLDPNLVRKRFVMPKRHAVKRNPPRRNMIKIDEPKKERVAKVKIPKEPKPKRLPKLKKKKIRKESKPKEVKQLKTLERNPKDYVKVLVNKKTNTIVEVHKDKINDTEYMINLHRKHNMTFQERLKQERDLLTKIKTRI